MQAVNPARSPDWRKVRQHAIDVLYNFAIDDAPGEEMAQEEKLVPFWEFVVDMGEGDDEYRKWARATLAKLKGVEITKVLTKQQVEAEKRKNADTINLDKD